MTPGVFQSSVRDWSKPELHSPHSISTGLIRPRQLSSRTSDVKIILLLPGFTGFPLACAVPSVCPLLSDVTALRRQGLDGLCRDKEEKRVDDASSIFYIGFKGEGEINTRCGNTRREKLCELCFQK